MFIGNNGDWIVSCISGVIGGDIGCGLSLGRLGNSGNISRGRLISNMWGFIIKVGSDISSSSDIVQR